MRLFAIFVLAPALAFNLYAMFQFWRELNRARPVRGRAGRFRTARIQCAGSDAPQKPRRSEREMAASSAKGVATFAAESKKRAGPDLQ